MRVVLVIIVALIIYTIYRMIKHYFKVKKSKDYKIAVGILDKMNYNTVITSTYRYYYSFELEGFNIRTETNSIFVDEVKLNITNDDLGKIYLFPDPGYHLIDKIQNKAEDIITKEERDAQEHTKKDAFISLHKRNK